MTPEMIIKARRNAEALGSENVELLRCGSSGCRCPTARSIW
ncbi:MAG: hypothetical protein WKF75_20180 [Singulisphaera sp.]